MICSFVISGESMLKKLVLDEDAACAAGVICLFVHYLCRLISLAAATVEQISRQFY